MMTVNFFADLGWARACFVAGVGTTALLHRNQRRLWPALQTCPWFECSVECDAKPAAPGYPRYMPQSLYIKHVHSTVKFRWHCLCYPDTRICDRLNVSWPVEKALLCNQWYWGTGSDSPCDTALLGNGQQARVRIYLEQLLATISAQS